MNSGCENILRADLVKSETLPIFVVPRCRRFTQSQTNIQATANKAGLFFGRFHFGDLDILADFQKGLASFVIYIPQIFVSKMPRCDKNLTANAQGASTSTANARKRVSKPAQAKPIYKVSIRAIGTWAADYKNGVYSSDIYQASNQEEAIGMACEHIKAKFPRHSILAEEIKCSLLNPATLSARHF